MRWEVSPGHTYPVLRVALDAGEEVVAEAGAMLLMRGPVDVSTSSRGIMKGIMRALLGSESFFLEHLPLPRPGGGVASASSPRRYPLPAP